MFDSCRSVRLLFDLCSTHVRLRGEPKWTNNKILAPLYWLKFNTDHLHRIVSKPTEGHCPEKLSLRAVFDSCSTPVRLVFDSYCGNRVVQSGPLQQELNRVEHVASIATSRGDVELSEKSYGIKIGSVVSENELKTSPVWFPIDSCPIESSYFCKESNRSRMEIT